MCTDLGARVASKGVGEGVCERCAADEADELDEVIPTGCAGSS